MKFIDGLKKAYNTKWSYNNSFRLEFYFDDYLISANKGADIPNDLNEYINLHIISFETPQYQNQGIEAFVANKYLIHNNKDELYRFTIQFRDKNQYELYRTFVRLYKKTREDYFDYVKFSIGVFKDADWEGEYDSFLYYLEDVIVESIGPIQFQNATDNQIGEFTVNFKCVKPQIFKN